MYHKLNCKEKFGFWTLLSHYIRTDLVEICITQIEHRTHNDIIVTLQSLKSH